MGGIEAGLHYTVSKAGLIGFTRTLAKEGGPYGINVNAVAPGIILTEPVKKQVAGHEESYTSTIPLRRLGTPLATFCLDVQRQVVQFTRNVTRLAGFDLPDPITMAVALDPLVVTGSRRLFVDVETGSALCRGQTVVDHLGITGREPNAEVVLEASRERFLELLFRAVREG